MGRRGGLAVLRTGEFMRTTLNRYLGSSSARRWSRLSAAALLGCLSVTLPVPKANAQRATLEKFISRVVLPNGLEVVVAENHGVPLATLEIVVRNGSFTQTAETAGLAHMYEHMFFKANAKLPRPDEFVQRASELGAVFNAQTREEIVNYYMTLPRDSVPGGLALMAAALREPKFLREELERERQVVLGEYDRNESNPFFDLQQGLSRLTYPGHYERKNIIGERDVLETVTPDQLREIQKKYYIPNNSLLLVTGDVKTADVMQWAKEEFGDWERGPDPFVADPIPPIPPIKSSAAIISEQPVSAVTVFIQWQGPSVRKDPKATFAADVFSDVLNQDGSKFQQRLVDSGLFQSIGFNYYTLDQVGPISVVGQTTPERLKEALAALDAELGRIGDPGYIDPEQVAASKAERAVSTAFGIERATDFSHTLGFWWAVASLDYYMGYIDGMAAQTVADLQAYAKKYIVGKNRITGVMIDPESRKRLNLSEASLLSRTVQ